MAILEAHSLISNPQVQQSLVNYTKSACDNFPGFADQCKVRRLFRGRQDVCEVLAHAQVSRGVGYKAECLLCLLVLRVKTKSAVAHAW
jgi:hypothetical protein